MPRPFRSGALMLTKATNPLAGSLCDDHDFLTILQEDVTMEVI
jgi:hypothetical protein